MAPKALGYLVGHAVAEGTVELKELPELLASVEEAESKRLFCACVFNTIKVPWRSDALDLAEDTANCRVQAHGWDAACRPVWARRSCKGWSKRRL